MRRLAFVLACTVACALPARAQDSLSAPVARGAVLRLTMGRVDATQLTGRLDRSDSVAVRLMVSGEEGDVRLRADRMGLTAQEAGTGDSIIVAVPWSRVRLVDVATGTRSRRTQNALLGGVIGGGLGGGLGAVVGAALAKSTCTAGTSTNTNCGISADAGQGALLGALIGGTVGAIVGASRESRETVWTPLRDRGKVLREGTKS